MLNMRETIATTLKKGNTELKDDEGVWQNIDHINQTEAELGKEARLRMKICSVLDDVMQVSILAILLLRSDLRVRGALIRKINIMGSREAKAKMAAPRVMTIIHHHSIY